MSNLQLTLPFASSHHAIVILRNGHTMMFAVGAIVFFVGAMALLGSRKKEDQKTVYGLQHGRLHLDAHVPMWMNMGYWKVNTLCSLSTQVADSPVGQ